MGKLKINPFFLINLEIFDSKVSIKKICVLEKVYWNRVTKGLKVILKKRHMNLLVI